MIQMVPNGKQMDFKWFQFNTMYLVMDQKMVKWLENGQKMVRKWTSYEYFGSNGC